MSEATDFFSRYIAKPIIDNYRYRVEATDVNGKKIELEGLKEVHTIRDHFGEYTQPRIWFDNNSVNELRTCDGDRYRYNFQEEKWEMDHPVVGITLHQTGYEEAEVAKRWKELCYGELRNITYGKSTDIFPQTVQEKINEAIQREWHKQFIDIVCGTPSRKEEPIGLINDLDIKINRGTSKNFTREQLTELLNNIKKYTGYGMGGKDSMTSFYKFEYKRVPEIKNVVIAAPYTTIIWMDGTKTQVKCMDTDNFDPEHGFAMAVLKKIFETKDKPNAYSKWVKKWVKTGLENGEKQKKKKAKKEKFVTDNCDACSWDYDDNGNIVNGGRGD